MVAKFTEPIIDRKYSIAAARQRLIQDGVDVRVSQRTLYNYVCLYGFPVLPDQMVQGPHKPRRESVRKRLAFNNIRGVSIEQRPDVINNRSEVGHHEMDTVVGPRGTKGVLLVLTERQTRAEHILVMKDKTAASVCAALDRLEQFYGARFKELLSRSPAIMDASSWMPRVLSSRVWARAQGPPSTMRTPTVIPSEEATKTRTA